MSDMNSIEEIARQVHSCTDCPLSNSRTNAVPGEGPTDAEILLIGEGPGYHEDRQGRPFVGPAGKFLEQLLPSIRLGREDVFIANMVKCRPSNNRDPLPAEIAACSKYLDRQIELVNPKLVVTLGRFSMARFFPKESISRARGKARKAGNLTVYPIMHPAAALHRQELRKAIEDDFKAIPEVLKLAASQAVEETGDIQSSDHSDSTTQQPQQLSMF
ncbi:MAG: uracil-DNA glycosylase [Dehalococcoidia bacterium]|nr:uracil-DNA glycosylase [Dehalococcoidia bacterium]